MPIPAVFVVKDTLNDGELDDGLFKFPLKEMCQPFILGKKSSTIITEITEDDVFGEEDTVPPGCLPNGNEESIDLSQRQLKKFPVRVFSICEGLANLYLQENSLESLPEELFPTFPFLRRLDVRKNKLTSIPSTIGGHRALEVLLLQNNQISRLPAELGHCPKLRNLQLQGNPLQWPEESVVKLGTQALLTYLREGDKPRDAVENSTGRGKKIQEKVRPLGSLRRNDCGDFCDKSMTAESSFYETDENSTLIGDIGGGESCTSNVRKLRYVKSISPAASKTTLPRRKSSCAFNDDPQQARLLCRRGQFPLGYKKKVSHFKTQDVYHGLLRQLWNDLLQDEMLSQAHSLQKRRNTETLRQWRQKARLLQMMSKGAKMPLNVPFDSDESLGMMCWRDLLRARNQSLEKKGHSKPHPSVKRAPDLNVRVLQLLGDLAKLRKEGTTIQENGAESAQVEYRLNLGHQINKMRELQKAMQSLRLL